MTPRLSLSNVSEPHPALHSYCLVLLILFCIVVYDISVELVINGTINYFFHLAWPLSKKVDFIFLNYC